MICPLLAIASPEVLSQVHRGPIFCYKEECAWYDEVMQLCSIKALPTCLVCIGNVIGHMSDKLEELRPVGR